MNKDHFKTYHPLRTKNGAVFAGVILLAVLILVNCLVNLLPYHLTQYDMTSAGIYSITGISRAFLKTLDHDVTIYCMTEDGKESSKLATFLSNYAAVGSHVNVEYVSLSDADFLKKYGIDSDPTDSSLVIAGPTRHRYLAYEELVYYYTETTGKISRHEYELSAYYYSQGTDYFKNLHGVPFSSIQIFFDGESIISNAIEYVTRDKLSYQVSLADSTKKFLREIETPVRLYCIWEGEQSECVLAGMLSDLCAENPLLSVTYMNPNTPEGAGFVDQYFSDQPSELTLVVESDKRTRTVEWSEVILYQHEKLGTLPYLLYSSYLSTEAQLYQSYQGAIAYGYCYSYYQLSQGQGTGIYDLTDVTLLFDGEEAYLNAIDYVTQPTVPHGYLLTGHGEEALGESLIKSMTDAGAEFENFTISESIPADAATVIINNPSSDLSDEETAILKKYLSEGGHLMLLTSPRCVELSNLMSLAADYGVTAESGTVSDSGKDAYLKEDPSFLYPTVNESNNINYYCYYLGYRMWFPNAHVLTLPEKSETGIVISSILNTSKEAKRISENGEVLGSSTTEYVDDKGETKTKEGTYCVAASIYDSNTHASILWYASGEAASETICADETDSNEDKIPDCGNRFYLSIAMSSLAKEFDAKHTGVDPVSSEKIDPLRVTASASRLDMDSLNIRSDITIILIGILLVILLPAGVLITGICIRNNRRKG